MKSNTLHETQKKLLDKLLLILGIIAIPTLISSLYRFFDIGWQPLFNVHITVAFIALLFAIFRKSISYNIKTYFLIVAFFILAISSCLNYGLSGFLIEHMMLSVFIGVIFLGRKHAIFIYSGCSAIILLIGILTSKGILSPNINIEAYNKNISSWISNLGGFMFVTGLVIIVAGEIGYLISAKSLELKELNIEIKKLQGILPICSKCKKIRNSEGYWSQVELYIEENSEAKFTHSLCEKCSEKLYAHQEWYQKSKAKQNRKNI